MDINVNRNEKLDSNFISFRIVPCSKLYHFILLRVQTGRGINERKIETLKVEQLDRSSISPLGFTQ